MEAGKGRLRAPHIPPLQKGRPVRRSGFRPRDAKMVIKTEICATQTLFCDNVLCTVLEEFFGALRLG